MTIGIALAWIVTIGSLAGLLWALTRIALHRRRVAAWQDRDDSATFSLDRYEPMGRLLAEEDLLFLKSQPGYRPEMGARWKRERRRILRMYLSDLKDDFRRLHAQARKLAAHSDVDSADLVKVLMKQQVTFFWTTSYLEFRLALERLGMGKTDVARFIELIEAMRLDLAQRTSQLPA
jgi:hypothetical protein